MSSGWLKKDINKMFLEIIYSIFVYKENGDARGVMVIVVGE